MENHYNIEIPLIFLNLLEFGLDFNYLQSNSIHTYTSFFFND